MDVTGPNDVVQGTPVDSSWPAGEAPQFAFDNDLGTKYLNFEGEVMVTGVQVAPAAGASVVTGLTFTTANDDARRDPITYEIVWFK